MIGNAFLVMVERVAEVLWNLLHGHKRPVLFPPAPQASFTSLSKTGKPLSKCGKCNRYIKYISAR